MKKISFYISFLCSLYLLLFSGCSAEEGYETVDNKDQLLNIQVTVDNFYSSDGTDTRAIDDGYSTRFEYGDKMGIFAMINGDVVVTCRNILCSYDGSKWDGDVPCYDNAQYFAYYPYDADMNTKNSKEEVVAAFAEKLKANTDQSTYEAYAACDLIASELVTPENKSLTFNFTHQMAMMEIVMPMLEYKKTADEQAYYIVPDYTNFTFALHEMKNVLPLQSKNAENVYRYIVAPGNYSFQGSFTSGYYKDKKYEQAVAFKAGKYKKINIKSDSSPLIHTIGIGDFFMNNGVVRAKGVANWLTDKEKQNCIGIVFYAKNPLADISDVAAGTHHDPTLEADHPYCTHGLVVSLHDFSKLNNTGVETICMCLSGGSIDINSIVKEKDFFSISSVGSPSSLPFIMGYNNTKALEYYNTTVDIAQNISVAAQEIDNYRNQYPIGCKASGWYIPSLKEMNYMQHGGGSVWGGNPIIRDQLNENIVVVGGQAIQGTYWVSSESGAGSFFKLDTDAGGVGGQRAWNKLPIRPVFAF